MLSDAQRSSLVTRLGRGQRAAGTAIAPRGPGVTDLPLSFGQEQLWFLDQFAPGQFSYHIPVALRISGRLDPAAMEVAVAGLIARHETLRTRLVNVDGTPKQVIDPSGKVVLPFVDLTAVAPEQRETEFHATALQEATQPFSLAEGPLLRTTLVRLGDREHVLLVTVHHAVADGWSFGVLCRELSVLYRQAAAGHAAALPDLPIQFADYALWERERLQGAALAELTAYWREALTGAQPLQLPTDRPRPPVQSFDGGLARLTMGAPTLAGLRALSQKHGTTLFVTVLAALQVLLHRYSGQDDFVVGTVSANRSRPELAPLIGYLVNTLPIRANLADNPSFVEHIQRVKETTVAGYAHQDLPFATLVDAVQSARDASRSPVFQVGFSVEDSPPEVISIGELSIQPVQVEAPVAKFDLDVQVRAWGELDVTVSFATALFDADTPQRLLRSLRVLLASIVADPTRQVRQLPILPEADRDQELLVWNRNDVTYPEASLTGLLSQQAQQRPEHPAVVFGQERLSYAELDRVTSRVARELRKRGVAPESLVGIHMRPSIHRLVSILGVLKAGGAYVPLDPDYPQERLEFMLEDTGTELVLSDALDDPKLATTQAEVVVPQRRFPLPAADLGTEPDAAPEPCPDIGRAAYVIYTSGSTGRPKGVVIEHRQIVNFVQGMIDTLSLGPDHRVLQFASLNFDVSVMDMFLALCSGATAVFGDRGTLLSPPRLAQLMRDERVTYACLPPALLDLLRTEPLPSQQILISAGEGLPPHVARAWHRQGLRLFNGYGLTETAVGATIRELIAADLEQPPIGLPIPNYRAYVLDEAQQPVPAGVVGELYVGGVSVARGYLHRPELTRERFLMDPFRKEPGARMYRTGDLVRRRADGNLLYLGRIDDQVKVHGLRIELGEIAATLADHPAVAQAVAAVQPGAGQTPQLVGYVRYDPDGPGANAAELQQYLARRLPGYLVPAQLILLETFPLSPNGKIDRAALPVPVDTDRPDATPPRTVLELFLTDSFARLLNRDGLGAEDNFFDVGGNSLLAMRLVSELSSTLAIDADVTSIFLAPTARQLAILLCERYGLADNELAESDLGGHG